MLPRNAIDSHVHFWDPGRPDWYPYLAPGFDASTIGVSHGRDMRTSYQLEDHLANTATAGVAKTVHINATGPSDAYLPEMERVSAVAAESSAIGAIQGKVDLTASPADLKHLLEEYQQFPLFRGVRILRVQDFGSAQVHTLLSWLTEHGRTLDLGVHPFEMATAADTLAQYTALDAVVEHAGWPRAEDLEAPGTWRAGLERLASVSPRVCCKISGLAMATGSVDAERLRPWISTVVDLFGSDRCMFGSNFPVDMAVGSYADIVDAYLTVLGELGPEALDNVFTHTAARFYSIPAGR